MNRLGPVPISFPEQQVQLERKRCLMPIQARSHNEANEAVASPKISKKKLPQMKNS